jgi:hypothetical protein
LCTFINKRDYLIKINLCSPFSILNYLNSNAILRRVFNLANNRNALFIPNNLLVALMINFLFIKLVKHLLNYFEIIDPLGI